ncbi:tetratricopeptide repeat protein [Fulvitalea axinellae]
MRQSLYPENLIYLDSAIQLTKSQSDKSETVKNLRLLIEEFTSVEKQNDVLARLNQILKDSLNFKNPLISGLLLQKRGDLYFDKKDFENASKDYYKAVNKFKISGDVLLEADAWYFTAQVLNADMRFEEAIECFEKAYSLYQHQTDSAFQIYTLNELASLYVMNRSWDTAIEERIKLKGLTKLPQYAKENALNSLNLADIYLLQNNYEAARELLEELKDNKLPVDAEFNAILHFYIYLREFRYALNLENVSEAKQKLQLLEKWLNKISNKGYFESEFFLATNRFRKHQEGAPRGTPPPRGHKPPPKRRHNILPPEWKIASLLEGSNPALRNRYMAFGNDDKSTIKTFSHYQKLFSLNWEKHTSDRQRRRIMSLENDKAQEAGKKNLLWIGLAITIALGAGALLITTFRNKKKRKALNSKLEQNKVELESFTQALLERSREKEMLSEELESLKTTVNEKQELDVLQELTSAKILTNEDWDEFKEKFITVNPHFFVLIQNKDINLTKSEERLLALEKLKLKTNDIANMLGVSSASIIKSRYRLRKKLELPKDVSLLDFIEGHLLNSEN